MTGLELGFQAALKAPQVPSRQQLASAIRRLNFQRGQIFAASFILLLVAVWVSLSLGVGTLTPWQLCRALLAPWLSPASLGDLSAAQISVVQNLRLPRCLMALISGAALAMAGVAMQGITRNPLVSPYTLGISPAAAFGASLAILFSLNAMPGAGPYWTVGLAFASAMVCALAVLGLASLRGVSSMVLVLAGVGLTYLFGALTATIQFVASEQQLAAIIHWTFGSLNGRTWDEVLIAGSVCMLCAPVLLMHSGALNAFAAGGDDVAASLGVSVTRTRILVTLAAVLASAGVVSFTGVIGFIGLVAPHISRLLIGGDHRLLLPFAAMVGALLVLTADMVGRLAFAPVMIPVGIVVAFLGVPLFLHLLLTRRHEMNA